MKKKSAPRKKNKIPVIPFKLEEVYSLSHYQAPEELYNRLKVWKASNDYQFISSLQGIIIKDYSSHNKKLSRQENEIRNQYINWLAIGVESDKFKCLDKIRLKDYGNLNSKNEGEEEEEEINDMLKHGGVL